MTDEYTILKSIKKLNMDIDNALNESINMYNLTASQCDILRYLIIHKDEKVCSTDIHSKLGISRASVSVTLKKLRNGNFIVFKSVPYDERVKYILLTEKAVKIQENIEKCFNNLIGAIYKDFSEEEKDKLYILIKKMIENVNYNKY